MFTSGLEQNSRVRFTSSLHHTSLGSLSAQLLDTILSENMNIGWLNGYFSITSSEEDRRTFLGTCLKNHVNKKCDFESSHANIKDTYN